jgi:hypothetical protein
MHALSFELPLAETTRPALPDIPFGDGATLAAVILIAATLVGGLLTRIGLVNRWSLPVATAIAAYLLHFEVATAAMIVGWAVLVAAQEPLGRIWPRFASVAVVSQIALVGLGVLVTLGEVARPERLAVDARATLDHPLFWSGATAALGALIAVLTLAWWLRRDSRRVWQVAALAAALAVYLLSVGLVDEFQGRVGEGRALEELQKQAQTGLSILWAALGGAAFVVGIVQRRRLERLFGLALFGLATAKVFVVDLASLDAAYRVLSFIGLGILLLASSYAYQHLMPRLTGEGEGPKGTHGSHWRKWTGLSHG